MTSTGVPARRSRRAGVRAAAGVCSVLVLLTTGACSKDGGSAMAARAQADAARATPAAAGAPARPPARPPAPTPPSPTDAAPLPDPTAPTGAAPTGAQVPILVGRRVTAAGAGLSFEVPDGWQAFDPSVAARAGASALPDAVKQLAAGSGLSVDEYLTQLGKAVEVMVTGRPVRGSADNISVIPTPVTQLPTEVELRSQLERVGATVTRTEHRTTPVGAAVVVDSRVPVGSFATQTRSVAVLHDGHVTYLTVTSTTRSRADSLLRLMLATLRST